MPLQRAFDTSATAVPTATAHRDPDGTFAFTGARPTPAATMAEGDPLTVSRPATELPVQLDAAAAAEPIPSPEPPPAEPVQHTDSAAAAAGQPTGPAAVAVSAGTVDIEDLARRLFDPLSARLKAELRLDRERAGLITDVRR